MMATFIIWRLENTHDCAHANIKNDCPICRQPFEQLLHSARGDDDYKEYVLSSPTRLCRWMDMERARSQFLLQCYSLCRWPTFNHPLAGRGGPAGTNCTQPQVPAPHSSSVQLRTFQRHHPVGSHPQNFLEANPADCRRTVKITFRVFCFLIIKSSSKSIQLSKKI